MALFGSSTKMVSQILTFFSNLTICEEVLQRKCHAFSLNLIFKVPLLGGFGEAMLWNQIGNED